MARISPPLAETRSVQVDANGVLLQGDLTIPEGSSAVVLFAHGSGSGRHSPRNRFVASRLNEAGLSTLLMDLLTEDEEMVDEHTGHLRFDIELLAGRLVGATDWLSQDSATAGLSVGYFGASTGGGAALVASTQRPDKVAAVVSRGGRPDLAGRALPKVRAATLLIVGGDDDVVIELNQSALKELGAATKKIVIVPGASHLFEEPGKLEEVARLATEWFTRHLELPPETTAD